VITIVPYCSVMHGDPYLRIIMWTEELKLNSVNRPFLYCFKTSVFNWTNRELVMILIRLYFNPWLCMVRYDYTFKGKYDPINIYLHCYLSLFVYVLPLLWAKALEIGANLDVLKASNAWEWGYPFCLIHRTYPFVSVPV